MVARDDLVPFSERSKDEAKESGKKGGVNSGVTRRKKKLMADVCRTFLALKPALNKDERKKLEEQGVNLKQFDMQAAAIYTQIAKAMKGDLQALVFLRDTAGEKPVEKTQSDMTMSNIKITIEGKPDD